MLDVGSFASLLNNSEGEGQTKLDPLYYTEMLVSLLYRLIEVAPPGQPRSVTGGLYDDVAHLATLAFMTTMLLEYGHDQSSPYLLLSDRLESAIMDLHVTSTGTQDSGSPFFLWSLFISGVSVMKGKGHRWLSLLILEACERLDLYDWPAIHRQLCGFPWIHTFHDVPGRCLWEEAQRRSAEISAEFLQLEACM